MSEPGPALSAPGHRDRRTGLILFGILLVAAGCVCALLAVFLLAGPAAMAPGFGGPTSPATRTGAFGPSPAVTPAGIATYAGLAVMFVWLGMGSILTRRWAPPLILTVGWLWLISGVMGIVMAAWLLPSVFTVIEAQSGEIPDSLRRAMVAGLVGALSIVMLVLPAALVLFYRSPHVRATCEARDPVPRWTDQRPPSVLGLSLSLALLGLSLLPSMLQNNGMAPCFGALVTGAPGFAINLALAAVWVYCAWSTYQLKSNGWWIAALSVTLATASVVVTFLRVDVADVYASMGMPPEQMAPFSPPSAGVMIAIAVACWLSLVGYLVYVRPHFRTRG